MKQNYKAGSRSAPVIAISLALLGATSTAGGLDEGLEGARQSIELSDGPVEGMRFALIPGGTFIQGTPRDEQGRFREQEGPQHEVTISSFEMMTTEVSQAMWYEVMGTTVQEQRDLADPEWELNGLGGSYPMYYVSRYQAEEFAAALNRLDPGQGYRLPTEAEWEYACRAGTTTRFYWGEDPDNSEYADYAWIDFNADSSHPVGQKNPNAWGLHDMIGNVFEWVSDSVSDRMAPYPSHPVSNPTGPAEGTGGIIRGGDWSHDDQAGRCGSRGGQRPDAARGGVGFRVVRGVGR